MAYGNIRMLGKRRILLVAVMLVTSIIATLGTIDYVNQNHASYSDKITKDSHIVHIKCNWVEGLSDEDFLYFANLFYQKALTDTEYYEFAATEAKLTLQYNDFEQLSRLRSGLGNCTFVDISVIDADDYIYGEQPVYINEIVVDKLLLERLMNSNSPIADLYTSSKDFLGAVLYDYTFDVSFKIVGICDTGEPTVYGMENAIMSITYKDYKYAFPEQLESIDVELADDEIILSESIYDKFFRFNSDEVKLFGMKNGVTYKVVGTIPDNLGIDYVLDNSQHDNMRRMFFSIKKGFYVYTDDVEAVISHYRKMAKEYDDILDDSFVSINVPYNDEIQEINKELEENISINPEMKNIVYIMVVIISVITIYFTMKSDSRRRGNEVAVYRLMGIPKKDIKAVYLLEMTILTIRVCATAVILTGIAVKLMTSIPSLEITLYFPWWILGIVIASFVIINGIISVAPVSGLLRKPPVHFVE